MWLLSMIEDDEGYDMKLTKDIIEDLCVFFRRAVTHVI